MFYPQAVMALVVSHALLHVYFCTFLFGMIPMEIRRSYGWTPQ